MATASVTHTFASGATIEHSEHNTNFNDLVTFLNANVVHADGAVAMSGDLDMDGNNITNLGTPPDVLNYGTIVFADESAELATGTGNSRFYLPFNVTITSVEISAGTAPTGAALTVDVNVDGTTIFTTQSNRPSIAATNNHDEATTVQDADHNDGQYITVDIDNVGSTIPGGYLVVVIRYERR